MAKSYQTFIAEATQKAVAEFTPHQKAIGLLMPKIVAANKGEKVVFTAEEQATLKSAAAAAKQFENASGLFTPKNLAALATQINNAKGIQATANKYAKSDAEKIAEKMADGTLIQPRQGGTQSVIGWNKLGDDRNRTNFTKARSILEKNPDFVELMQDFANPDDPNSENFGATKAGKYAKVVIEFELLSSPEMDERAGTALGVAGVEANINGTWTNIQNCAFNLIKDVYKQIRVIVLLRDKKPSEYQPLLENGKDYYKVGHNGKPEKLDEEKLKKQLPLTNDQFAQPIRIVTHEIFVHARAAAERLSKFQKMPTLESFNKLLAETDAATGNDQSNQLFGSVFSKEHQAISGIDENGNPVPYNEEYERVNDKTYEILKNETGTVVRQKQKSPNPGQDDNSRMYLFADLDQKEKSKTIEYIPKAEAFLHERLNERKDYTSITTRPIVEATITQEYIDAKSKK